LVSPNKANPGYEYCKGYHAEVRQFNICDDLDEKIIMPKLYVRAEVLVQICIQHINILSIEYLNLMLLNFIECNNPEYESKHLKKLEIQEGDEVFFCGLFESHYGQQKNQPIMRFGKVALMTDEKIE
jgi:hypothetical protein